jgi:hypothetical protein
VYEKLVDFLELHGGRVHPAAEAVFRAEADPALGWLTGPDAESARAVFADRQAFLRMRGCVEAGLTMGPDAFRQAEVLLDLFLRHQEDEALARERQDLEERHSRARAARIPVESGSASVDELLQLFATVKGRSARSSLHAALEDHARTMAPLVAEMIAVRNRSARASGDADHGARLRREMGIAGAFGDRVASALESAAQEAWPRLRVLAQSLRSARWRPSPDEEAPESWPDPILLHPTLDLVLSDAARSHADRQLARLLERLGWPELPRLGEAATERRRHPRIEDPFLHVRALISRIREREWELARALVKPSLPPLLRPAVPRALVSAVGRLIARSAADRDHLVQTLGLPPRRAAALRQRVLRELAAHDAALLARAALGLRFLDQAYAHPGQDLLARWRALAAPEWLPLARAARSPVWSLVPDLFHPALEIVRRGMGVLLAREIARLLDDTAPNPDFLSRPEALGLLRDDLVPAVIVHGLDRGFERATGRPACPAPPSTAASALRPA